MAPAGTHNPDILDEFDREINKVSDSFLPGLGETLDEVDRLLDPNNINRGNVPAIELPNRDGGFDLGDRANPWDFIFHANEREKAANEGRMDDYLRARGETVVINPREGQSGAGRQGDRYVNGELTEYKTLSPAATPNTIYRRVNESLRDGGQAPNVIVDVRETTITVEGAEEAIRRMIESRYIRERLDSVRIVGRNPDGSIFDIPRPMPR